jgi:hypothetical protein
MCLEESSLSTPYCPYLTMSMLLGGMLTFSLTANLSSVYRRLNVNFPCKSWSMFNPKPAIFYCFISIGSFHLRYLPKISLWIRYEILPKIEQSEWIFWLGFYSLDIPTQRGRSGWFLSFSQHQSRGNLPLQISLDAGVGRPKKISIEPFIEKNIIVLPMVNNEINWNYT